MQYATTKHFKGCLSCYFRIAQWNGEHRILIYEGTEAESNLFEDVVMYKDELVFLDFEQFMEIAEIKLDAEQFRLLKVKVDEYNG